MFLKSAINSLSGNVFCFCEISKYMAGEHSSLDCSQSPYFSVGFSRIPRKNRGIVNSLTLVIKTLFPFSVFIFYSSQ